MVNSYQSVKFQANQMSTSSEPSGSIEVNRIENNNATPKYGCSRCGKRGHRGDDSECPALHEYCRKCNRKGHYARCCRSQQNYTRRVTRPPPKRGHGSSGGLAGSPKRSRYQSVRNIELNDPGNYTSFVFNIGDGDELLWVTVGGILIQVLIDSGSEKNIIDDVTWQKMEASGVEVKARRLQSNQKFKGYGKSSQPLLVKEFFEATIAIETPDKRIEKEATFYVIQGGSQCLLGRVTAKELGVLVLGLPSTQPMEIFNLQISRKQPFPKFKGIQLDISIDKSITPVVQHARRPPVALLQKIEHKLESLLVADIIEPVNEYSEWVSPLVVIVKDNGELRLCVDMRRANQAIKREAYMMPTFEDFLPKLKEARVFSRLDIKDAFHQIELKESCRYITTFITHKGVFRYKRLMFGISCAPEMFQMIIEQSSSDCENTVNFVDDILVFGETETEHNRELEKVLAILKAKNVLLNFDKCVFRTKEVTFLGHHISAKGIKPTNDKIATLKTFRSPETVEELKSYLGLVTYIGRFLPDLATVTAPLRALTHTGTPFVWEDVQEKAFNKLKKMISDIKTLKCFDNSLRTRLIVDASPVGLGAVLVQFKDPKDDCNPRIISYASKSLSPTEKRYCQTEKEALAIVCAVERFSVYLLGRKFELETDHKPLEAIFSTTSRPCARIERWILRLQAYSYVVRYRKGSTNIADPLSRLSKVIDEKDFDGDNEFLILAVMESAAIDTSELEKASQEDEELKLVRKSIQTGKWGLESVKPYETFRTELGFVGDLLVRGSKLIVPQILRARMLALAHEGHPGETVMKRRLRDRVWWPGMDREIVKHVTSCEGCRLVTLPEKPEPMHRRQMPLKAWVDVALDFLGPLPSGEYLLVIVDYYSRYKEIEVMSQITAKETTIRLHKIFTRLGFPVTITLDNARQFVSQTFDDYCTNHGIHLNHSTPYWPQENGLVERQNRSLLKRLQISHAMGRNWKEDLYDYLMMYYTTPHSVTGKTPTELCFGRTIRSKIPSLTDVSYQPTDDDVREADQISKQKGKEREDEKRGAKFSSLQSGDTVLMKNLLPGNKLTPAFDRQEYTVVQKRGPRVTIRNKDTGKIYERNVTHVKRVPDSEALTDASKSSEAPTTEDPPRLMRNQEAILTPDNSRSRRDIKLPSRYDDYIIDV
ncbi:uncharacterized protein K02A2.6-like [Uranotaenia lowii]|uniref:uncharacterized protein K02A2.6-like n=1 Tax=Uranotaenia lowii TaxID=190385 RepID=UPI00247AA7EE|nr:uncharacterized protein K02A2.6-like [Uranotaenia lowii]